jgi:hypothetical protein
VEAVELALEVGKGLVEVYSADRVGEGLLVDRTDDGTLEDEALGQKLGVRTQAAAARNESFRERDHLVGGERKGAPCERGGLVDEQRLINISFFFELWFRDRGCEAWRHHLRLKAHKCRRRVGQEQR